MYKLENIVMAVICCISFFLCGMELVLNNPDKYVPNYHAIDSIAYEHEVMCGKAEFAVPVQTWYASFIDPALGLDTTTIHFYSHSTRHRGDSLAMPGYHYDVNFILIDNVDSVKWTPR